MLKPSVDVKNVEKPKVKVKNVLKVIAIVLCVLAVLCIVAYIYFDSLFSQLGKWRECTVSEIKRSSKFELETYEITVPETAEYLYACILVGKDDDCKSFTFKAPIGNEHMTGEELSEYVNSLLGLEGGTTYSVEKHTVDDFHETAYMEMDYCKQIEKPHYETELNPPQKITVCYKRDGDELFVRVTFY